MDALGTLNGFIRGEHGNPVSIESKWMDSEVDSFGTTMVFLEMDEKYKCFPNEWFLSMKGKWADVLDENGTVVSQGITIREIVERAMNESTIV